MSTEYMHDRGTDRVLADMGRVANQLTKAKMECLTDNPGKYGCCGVLGRDGTIVGGTDESRAALERDAHAKVARWDQIKADCERMRAACRPISL